MTQSRLTHQRHWTRSESLAGCVPFLTRGPVVSCYGLALQRAWSLRKRVHHASPGRELMSKQPAVIYDENAQRLADEMIAAEARHIARRKAEEQECDCKDGMFPRAGMTDRRK